MFNTITGINESKTLTKHISCECKYRFDGKKNMIQINGGTMTNADVSIKMLCMWKRLYLKSCYM